MTNVLLDCETRLSAEASLLETFDCSSPDLRRFLTDPITKRSSTSTGRSLPEYDLFLNQRACEVLGNPRLPTELCWFHCTRVPAEHVHSTRASCRIGDKVLPQLKDKVLLNSLLENTLGARARNLTKTFSREAIRLPLRKQAQRARFTGDRMPSWCARSHRAQTPLVNMSYRGVPEIIEDLCQK